MAERHCHRANQSPVIVALTRWGGTLLHLPWHRELPGRGSSARLASRTLSTENGKNGLFDSPFACRSLVLSHAWHLLGCSLLALCSPYCSIENVSTIKQSPCTSLGGRSPFVIAIKELWSERSASRPRSQLDKVIGRNATSRSQRLFFANRLDHLQRHFSLASTCTNVRVDHPTAEDK